MGSLVGGVSLTLCSTSDDAEPPLACWGRIGLDDVDLGAGVGAPAGFAPGLPKKLMRLFCFMFSDDARFCGVFGCNGMVDVERDGKVGPAQSRRCGALWHVCVVSIFVGIEIKRYF